MKMSTMGSITEIHLEVFTAAMRTELARHQLENIEVQTSLDISAYSGRNAAFEIVAYITGRKRQGEPIRYPATWLDAFKLRWFPRWLLRRYPVTYTVLVPETTEMLPDIRRPDGRCRSFKVAQFSPPKLECFE